jgi:beta-hydroxylase
MWALRGLAIGALVLMILGEVDRRSALGEAPCEHCAQPEPAWEYWVAFKPSIPVLGVSVRPVLGVFNSLVKLLSWHNRAWYNELLPEICPEAATLAAHYEEIRHEALRMLPHIEDLPSFRNVNTVQRFIDRSGDWKVFVLKWYGDFIPENVRLAPRTHALLEKIPGLKSAMFSVLPPGVGIPKHRGHSAVSLRYQLPLVVASGNAYICDAYICGNAYISVNGVKQRYEEGTPMLFDDTYDHYVVNNTTGYRVVLFADVQRPIPEPAYSIVSSILSSPLVLSFFTGYQQKTELHAAVCCDEHCGPDTFCPESQPEAPPAPMPTGPLALLAGAFTAAVLFRSGFVHSWGRLWTRREQKMHLV